MATSTSLLRVCLLLSVVFIYSSCQVLPTAGLSSGQLHIFLEDDSSVSARSRQTILLSFLVGKNEYTDTRSIELALGLLYNFRCAILNYTFFGSNGGWTKDGSQVSTNRNANVYAERSGQYLILYLRFLSIREAGVYKCTFRGMSLKVDVTVGTDPILISSTPYTLLDYGDREAPSLNCFFAGALGGSRAGEWTKSGADASYTTAGRSIHFEDAITASHYGTYVYIETTSNGQASVSNTVEVAGAARLATGADVTDITLSSATIHWTVTTPYRPTSPDTFTVLYGYFSLQLWFTSQEVPSNPADQMYSVELPLLVTGTRYYYQIRSQVMSDELLSGVKNFYTLLTEVADLRVESRTRTQLVVAWEAPSSDMWAALETTPPTPTYVSSYYVSIVNLLYGYIEKEISTADAIITISNLEPGIPYNITVEPMNSGGPGLPKNILTFTEELAPSIPPKNVSLERLSPTEVQVSWTPLSYVEARGIITQYSISYYDEDDTITFLTVSPTDTSSTATIEALDSDMGYVFKVSATTGGGRSDFSPPLAFGIARMPISVMAVSIESDRATIEWTLAIPFSPAHPGTFTVRYGPTESLSFSTETIPASKRNNEYSIELNSLDLDTEFYYSVRSMTDVETVDTGVLSFITQVPGNGTVLYISATIAVLLLMVVAAVTVATALQVSYRYITRHGGWRQTPIAERCHKWWRQTPTAGKLDALKHKIKKRYDSDASFKSAAGREEIFL